MVDAVLGAGVGCSQGFQMRVPTTSTTIALMTTGTRRPEPTRWVAGRWSEGPIAMSLTSE